MPHFFLSSRLMSGGGMAPDIFQKLLYMKIILLPFAKIVDRRGGGAGHFPQLLYMKKTTFYMSNSITFHYFFNNDGAPTLDLPL